ncbi:MAG: hypothetical protein U9N84_01855 [Actinomycetota bacterium]|nr:hypothetical protein [Actinomycetota bacterium]
MRRAALIAILILAACGGDSETTTTASPAPVLTTLADAPVPPTTTTVAPPTTTTSTTIATTTTLPPNAAAEFGLTQVVFGGSAFVVITNWGNDTGNLRGHWLCQFPSYQSLPDIELAPGEQVLVGLSTTPPPQLSGMAITVDLGAAIGILDPNSGEVALYDSSSFENPESIMAYVEWGEAGHHRATLAIQAGVWSEGAVEVFDEAPSISSGVFPAISNTDWFADVGG